jgi:AcrR family transcriptional regulator
VQIYECALMKVKANTRTSSQIAQPREPRRRRGEIRVAALLESAALTFAEKGYQGATMTEIAARAGAAIGSLYQFFPSKEALAAALLQRYGELMEVGLAELVEGARTLTPRGLANELISRRLERRPEREAVLAVTEAPVAAGERARRGEAIKQHLARALKAVNPSLSGRRPRAMASVIVHLLKQVPGLVEEDRRRRLGLLRELRTMLALYITGAPQ